MRDPTRIELRPGETVDIDFEFANLVPAGDSIVSQSATADAGLSLGGISRSGTVVKQYITTSAVGEFRLVVTATMATRIRQLAALIRVVAAP